MWRSGEVCSPWICGGGVALRPLSVGSCLLGLVFKSRYLVPPSWFCLSEILRLVLSCGHGWEACSLGVVNRVGFSFVAACVEYNAASA